MCAAEERHNAESVVVKVAEFLRDFHGEVNDSQVGKPLDYLSDAIELVALIDGMVDEK